MELKRQLEYLQAQRASELFEDLKQDRPESVAAFQEWCSQSARHTAEFLEIAWTDHVLNDLDPRREKDVDSLLQLINPNIAQLSEAVPRAAETSGSLAGRHRWGWALAAVILVSAIGLAFLSLRDAPAEKFSTGVGEQNAIALQDHSTVTLNTDSEIQVKFERGQRNVELRHGEALFKVARDPARPFRVHTRSGMVQAVGTQFNVYDRPDGTAVTVLEGRVRLTAYQRNSSREAGRDELTAGQEALIASDGAIIRSEHADLGRVVAWSRQRRLKFDDVSLEEMAREFNRYHHAQVRLEGVRPGSHHYSGLFDADDPTALVRLLSQERDLQVEQVGKDIVIRPRADRDGTLSTE